MASPASWSSISLPNQAVVIEKRLNRPFKRAVRRAKKLF